MKLHRAIIWRIRALNASTPGCFGGGEMGAREIDRRLLSDTHQM